MAGPPPAGCSPVTECVTGQQWRSAGRHRVEVTVSDDGESGTAGFEESAIVLVRKAFGCRMNASRFCHTRDPWRSRGLVETGPVHSPEQQILVARRLDPDRGQGL